VDKFWELLNRSVIVQSLITLLFSGTIVYLIVSQMPVPEELWLAFGSILGFYFGTKVQQNAQAR
jgi:hypothetical protein